MCGRTQAAGPRAGTLPAVGLMAALLVACGGGGPPEQTGATPVPDEGPASREVFCESIVATEEAVFRTATGRRAPPIEPLVNRVQAAAPAEIDEEVDAVASAIRETLETGDDAPLLDPQFGDHEERIDVWVAANCGFEPVRVTAVDYTFEGVPKTIPAGITTFALRNEGEEVHEMLTVRLLDEAISAKDLGNLSEKGAEDAIDYIGSAFARPSGGDVDSRNLIPGRYALVCLLPVGSTDPAAAGDAGRATHFARGMWAELVVK